MCPIHSTEQIQKKLLLFATFISDMYHQETSECGTLISTTTIKRMAAQYIILRDVKYIHNIIDYYNSAAFRANGRDPQSIHLADKLEDWIRETVSTLNEER